MSRATSILRAASAALLLAGVTIAPAAAQGPPMMRPGGPGGQRESPLPLNAARKANFTATRGTWISLDVSPDGQTIVFDLLGDLYTMPITGGKAKRLTSGLAYDAQPRFSPDGKRIVFISDRSGGDNVWVMSLDMVDTIQVTQGNTSMYFSPEWMPDGEMIVVSRSGGLGGAAKLEFRHVDRRSPLPVIQTPSNLKMLGAAPSPDGRYIWYAARSGDWQYNAAFPQYQLYRYDRKTGTSTLMTNRYGSGFRPAISPDGRWLVYGTREGTETGLRIRDLTTGDERWLAYPVQRDDMEARATLDVLPGYSFTPDSRAVVVSYGGEIWRVPVDGSPGTKIPFEVDVQLDIGPEVKFTYHVDTSATVVARQIRNPVPSPDGRWIAFTAFDRLWVKQLPDGEPRRVSSAEVGEYHPAWSPDGRWIAYVTWDDHAGGHIMRAPAPGNGRGGAPTQLTRVAALYYNVAWSPDGGRIVASRAAARELKEAAGAFFGPLGGEFVWVPATGGDVTVIAPTGSRDVAHFNRNEPDRIYAYSPLEGLVSFRWDGTDVKRHLQVRGQPPIGAGTPHEEEYAFMPRRVFPVPKSVFEVGEQGPMPPPAGLVMISPTGDRALAQVGSHIYVMEIPVVGATPPTLSVANPQSAPVPMRQLTQIGGEFPAWSADGTTVHWAIGNAFISYDVARHEAAEDSVRQERREAALALVRAKEVVDSLKAVRARVDSLTKANAEVPDSLTARLNKLRADSIRSRADTIQARMEALRALIARTEAKADSVEAGDTLALQRPDTALYRPDERRIRVTMPRDIPRGTVVLRGGRALTMKEHEIIENADIVVQDGKIVAIGPRDSVEVPADAQIIDITGTTVTPGFVDTHYHAQWLIPEIHPTQTWQYLATLAYGVTTTRDPQTATTDVLSYQDRVEIGSMIGPRIYSTGPGVFLSENIRSLQHAKDVLTRYAKYYDTKTLKMYMTGNRQQRQWIIMAAKELGIMPTTEGGLDYKLDITHAMDGYPGIEHNLPIAPVYDDIVELFKASKTTNSPTLLVSYGGPFGENYFYTKENVHDDPKLQRFIPEANLDARSRRRGPGAGGSPGASGWFLDEEYIFPKHAEFIKRLIEGGGRAAVGSHGQIQGIGYHWEMWAMASGGLSNHDLLRAATIFGAEAIGLGQDIGTLEAGKFADILVMDADPLQDIRNTVRLRYVMKNGRLYDANTLDEVWPRQRSLASQPWWSYGPGGVGAGVR